MSETMIEIGDTSYTLPFCAVGWFVEDSTQQVFVNAETDVDANYITTALNDYRPWRYPSRGEFAETGKWYLVTTDSGEVVMAEAEDGLKWWDENEYPLHIRAWRELPEPAPALEDK